MPTWAVLQLRNRMNIDFGNASGTTASKRQSKKDEPTAGYRYRTMYRGKLFRVALAIAPVVAFFVAGAANAQNLSGGDPDRGRGIAEAKCASCHGADGNGADAQYPKLAGQNLAYLDGQLWAFKTGARRSDIMSAIVAGLPEADLVDAASFYARQMIRPDRVKDTALVSLGQDIVYRGIGGAVPACAMCHNAGGGMSMMMGRMPMMGMMGGGMMGRGMMADVPNLNGQHALYIVRQLDRFATGERPGTVMGRIAKALSKTDRRAVADFLSGLR